MNKRQITKQFLQGELKPKSEKNVQNDNKNDVEVDDEWLEKYYKGW